MAHPKIDRGHYKRPIERGEAVSVEHTPKDRCGSLTKTESDTETTFNRNQFIKGKQVIREVRGFIASELYGDDAERFIEQDKIPLTDEEKRQLEHCRQIYKKIKVKED